MAETVLNLLLEKITNVAVTEVLHLWGVGEQVEKVKSELGWIQAFLKDADRKQIVDETQKQWVKEVREVGYRIEDAIDTFLYEIPEKKLGKREFVKRLLGKTKKLPVIHKLGDEMNQILAKLQEIGEKKVRYGINNLGEGSGGKRLPIRPPILPDIEDPDVVCFDVDRDNIVKVLLDKDTPRRSVVSIVGDEVKRTFETRTWITISQEFELVDVLGKILVTLGRKADNNRGEDYLLMELYQSLKGKKYLLVIDDVWTTDLMTALGRTFPDDKNGSRILMTTRISEVGRKADLRVKPYELKFLTEKASLELFLKKALPDQESLNECPCDLLDLATQFVRKCSGLPLALIVLGSLLASKQPTYLSWSKAMQTMNWHAVEQKGCMEIIATSYDNLPFALKSCFMYFSAFPEDHAIDAQSLLWMWIAEGFIPQEENRTLEDTAESFLEDLVQRSMIQASKRTLHNDSIEICRIHDLLLDVAIEKAKKDNFLTVCTTLDGDAMESCGRARRVAVHNLNCNEVMKYASPNLRTLLCFNSRIPDCSRHRLIKVFSDNCHKYIFDEPLDMKWFQGLSQLKYLHIYQYKIDGNQRYFEKLIGGMKFLQTLDVPIECQPDLPDCLWNIKTLRFIETNALGYYLPGPPPISDLPNLQTLDGIETRKSWDYTNLPNIPNLRHLGIEISEEFPWGIAAAFFQTLKKLLSLDIKGRDIPTKIVDMKEFPFYQHLTYLGYEGSLSCHGLDVTMFPTHLTFLSLRDSELQEDPIVVLEKLQGLKSLELLSTYENETMRFSTGGFPRLQELSFRGLYSLEEWKIEEGAMPMLKHLTIEYCSKLQVPQGLQHLTTLTDLTWHLDVYDNSSPSKAKKIRSICKHVSSITIIGVKEDTDDAE